MCDGGDDGNLEGMLVGGDDGANVVGLTVGLAVIAGKGGEYAEPVGFKEGSKTTEALGLAVVTEVG